MTFDEESLEFWKRLPRYPVMTQELLRNTFGQQLLTALRNSHKLEITYAGLDKPISERTICPIEAISVSGIIYIRAFCLLRQEERTFRLDRILNARIIEEGHPYAPKPSSTQVPKIEETPQSNFSWIWWLVGIGLIIFLLLSKR